MYRNSNIPNVKYIMRTDEEKLLRKIENATKSSTYKSYYEKNPNIVNKCTKCDEEKPLKEFINSYHFRKLCKLCFRIRAEKWRKSNPEKAKAIRFKGTKHSYEYVRKFKLDKPCVKCGTTYPPCAMDFNHKNGSGKYEDISNSCSSGIKKIQRIENEVTKCELICANCHRNETQSRIHEVDVLKNRKFKSPVIDIELNPNEPSKECNICGKIKHVDNFKIMHSGYRHSYCNACLRDYNNELNRKGRKHGSREFIKTYKDNKPCTDCKKVFRYWILDFDHKYSKYHKLNNRSVRLIKDEIGKYDLVCACCHRIRTEERKKNLNTTKLEITEFLSQNNVTFVIDHIISNNIYDIFLVEKKILVDCQDLKSHGSTQERKRDQEKAKLAINNGYQFLSIFEDEWRDRPNAFKAIIRNKLNVHKPISLRPSKCDFVRPSTVEANELYERFHYIGACKSKIHYGVVFDGKLIACVSFATPTRQSVYEWELIRMVSDPEYRIHGAWSKILGKFIHDYNPKSIVSFSDNRIFQGGTYEKIGFRFDGDVSPNYYWAKDRKRYHKSGLRKPKGELRTETVIRTEQGYERVWDIGKKRWILYPEQTKILGFLDVLSLI